MARFKIAIPSSFDNFKQSNIRKVPTNCLSPMHNMVSSMMFPFTVGADTKRNPTVAEQSEVVTAALEANLADAVARVAELNGFDADTTRKMIPAILRMLGSESEWAKS